MMRLKTKAYGRDIGCSAEGISHFPLFHLPYVFGTWEMGITSPWVISRV